MAALIERKGDRIDITCSTMSEFLSLGEESLSLKGKGSHCSRDNSKGFTGTESFQEAISMARVGWDHGRAAMEEAVKSMPVNLEEAGRGYRWDVVGQTFDMGAFVSGEPEHWLEPAYEPTRRIVTLIVNIGASAGVAESTIANRGAAIMSLVKALQERGDIVDITAVWCNSCVNGHWHEYRVRIGTTPLDLDQITYLGHPSFMRRHGFGAMEVVEGDGVNLGKYGYPEELPDEDIVGEGTVLYLGINRVGTNTYVEFQTLDKAAAWLRKKITEICGEEEGA